MMTAGCPNAGHDGGILLGDGVHALGGAADIGRPWTSMGLDGEWQPEERAVLSLGTGGVGGLARRGRGRSP